jgi:hypothetical protein
MFELICILGPAAIVIVSLFTSAVAENLLFLSSVMSDFFIESFSGTPAISSSFTIGVTSTVIVSEWLYAH